MGITKELREYAEKQIKWLDMTKVHYRKLLAIADRIDAEYQKACEDAWNNGYEADYLGIEKWLTEHPQAMEHHGWVRLPKDADGVPIRVGDKVDSDHYEDGTVIGVHYFKAPNGVVFEEIAVQPNGWDTATWRDPEEYAHHHAPTVEDMLREFAEKITDSQIPGVHPTYEEAIAEYAAKLQLREVDE